MELRHPDTKSLFDSRDRLLQDSLRPPRVPFGISLEYPIVLDRRRGALSWCAVEGDRVVAHANLWPRTLVDRESERSFRIGLIGNVATDKALRGQGLMGRLFDHLKAEAARLGLEALVLWADRDLFPFYQKLRFNSCGRERRLSFGRKTLEELHGKDARHFLPIDSATLEGHDLAELLARRCVAGPTLERHPEEFATLLTIPATDLFVNVSAGEIRGYCLSGKGCDMVGVVHEWGAASPDRVLKALSDVLTCHDWSEIMLLVPEAVDAAWLRELSAHADSSVEHPMALVHVPKPGLIEGVMQRAFIWGLDSI